MSRYEFKLADASDDKSLRLRMSEDCMEGSIRVSFRREPSYFIGSQVQGDSQQIIKCTDKNSHQLIGLGARLTLDVFINGTARRMGYLSDLRVAPSTRGGTLLARGYQYLYQLHKKDPVPLYYSLILQDNHPALNTLTQTRAGLPAYHDRGKILTPAIHLDLKRKLIKEQGLHIQRASPSSLDKVFGFVRQQYAKKQFSPVYHASDIGNSRLTGLRAEDIYIASRQGKIVGITAAWDQCSFRQTHVEKYSPWLKKIRPAYNFSARFSALKALPDEGAALPYFYLALIAIEQDDPAIFRALLAHIYQERRLGEWHYFIAGLHEQHPLVSVLNEYRSIKAAGHLFLVHYPEDQGFFKQLDQRIPHIEIGAV